MKTRLAVGGGAAALTAVFVVRFVPARLLLIETARPAIAAVIVLLAAFAFGCLALRLSRARAHSPASDALLIGFATFGIIAGATALITTTIAPILAILGAFA